MSVISNLIGSFVKISEVNDSWIEEFTHLLQRNCSASPSLLLPATHAFLNEICDCLYDSRKRWCAFHLMHLFAKDTKPLQSGDDSILFLLNLKNSYWYGRKHWMKMTPLNLKKT
jgi:hypothetical protein